ncbi:putative Zinc finger, RING-CH-type, Zinc finger, RING/FYVE/PHD-type [Helianthus annuus]|nr:putative Zinc finger, RING-CH-type, Zinc finger, RING/FYVE/PHD-type [Helianthus annuus]
MEIAPPDGVGNLPESSSTSTDNNNLSSNRYDDEEEEEDVCRICRNPGDADNPLRYPCACSGSIKFVHQDCLLQWLNHSNARHCEAPLFILPCICRKCP